MLPVIPTFCFCVTNISVGFSPLLVFVESREMFPGFLLQKLLQVASRENAMFVNTANHFLAYFTFITEKAALKIIMRTRIYSLSIF
jgi:hypothetical protein